MKAVIAEDDFRIADIHEKYLSTFDEIDVVGKALNGEQTLELIKIKQPDLLILDVFFPDMMGTDLLPLIRNDFPKVDIIMITAATDKEFIEAALNYGVIHYLIKPVNRGRFDEVISEYIKRHAILMSNQEINQTYVDLLFGKNFDQKMKKNSGLPKGIDEITLEKVQSVLLTKRMGLSAEEVAKEIGASRITARRYLEYLSSINEAKAEVVYGIVGRPERKYYPV
ncbi:transcriptional regulator [Rummeliibacillus stabekisii]|uniref:Transcriptional regulatory protein n=1 Tax=Rummeliibacillus stabekisii TaxID=241244 RepID=A0A143HI16_9BACL|nr:transcriptional regulator [Rummeliibacillus stabekisii]